MATGDKKSVVEFTCRCLPGEEFSNFLESYGRYIALQYSFPDYEEKAKEILKPAYDYIATLLFLLGYASNLTGTHGLRDLAEEVDNLSVSFEKDHIAVLFVHATVSNVQVIKIKLKRSWK